MNSALGPYVVSSAPADQFTPRALHPFDPKSFSLWVDDSKVNFCGMSRELKGLDVGELTNHSVRLTASAGKLGD